MTNPMALRFVSKVVMRTLAMFLMLTPAFAQPQNPPKPSTPPFSLFLEVMTDPEGFNLGPYLKSVYKSIQSKALETMPPSVARGDQGEVSIRLQIQRDGTLASPPAAASALLTFVLRSGKKALDDHAMTAISRAAPFEHLPENFSAPSLELKLTFFYNIAPPSR
jgi:outer membrane biosynthesis protein TonB